MLLQPMQVLSPAKRAETSVRRIRHRRAGASTITLHETFENAILCAWANDVGEPDQIVTAYPLSVNQLILYLGVPTNPVKWYAFGH